MTYQLVSTIPGVTVRLTQNPLNARVEITDAAKRVIALMLWTEHLVENYFLTAGCYLTPGGGSQVDGVYVPNRPDPGTAASWLEGGSGIWYRDWHGEKGGKDTSNGISRMVRILNDEVVQCYFESLASDHSGDCTCFAAPCERCHTETVLGVNTLPSGKHVNHRLGALYFDEFATPEARVLKEQQKSDSAARHLSQSFVPDAGTKKRWSDEDALALAVYEKHQRLYREQEALQ